MPSTLGYITSGVFFIGGAGGVGYGLAGEVVIGGAIWAGAIAAVIGAGVAIYNFAWTKEGQLQELGD